MQPISVIRDQMTYQQVRAWSVLPPATLNMLEQLPRELFVPESWRRAAYADLAIPLGEGQHMLQPSVVGRILQAVEIQPANQIIEIGTGSGYLTACMALLGAQVRSVEIRPEFVRNARKNLKAAGIGNAQVEDADAFALPELSAAYDVVVLTGSMPIYDARFEALLRPGGRLFGVTGQNPVMEAQLVRLDSNGIRTCRSLFETVLDPLANAPTIDSFAF
jgi:protein-L-isoaspartate(D-aspartate) O-methyltransferase